MPPLPSNRQHQSYLSSLINLNTTSRALRSSSLSLLHVPFTTTAIGRRAFRFAAPTIWNSIPLSIISLPSLNSFKRSLKTHLFSLDSPWSRPCYTSASDSSFAWICVLYKFCIIIILIIKDNYSPKTDLHSTHSTRKFSDTPSEDYNRQCKTTFTVQPYNKLHYITLKLFRVA